MRVLFFGMTKFSRKALELLVDMKVNIVGIVANEYSDYTDFDDLTDWSAYKDISYAYYDKEYSKEICKWMRLLKPDIGLAFGWGEMLPKEILEIPKKGIVGYHPTALPLMRGRHPLIWTLVKGIRRSGSTFFFMDEGVDSGPIISQKFFDISKGDNIRTLQERVHKIALGQIKEFVPKLEHCAKIPQSHSRATYMRKRTDADGELKENMTAEETCNLVKALTHPYPGAWIMREGKKVRIWEATPDE